MVFDGVTPNNLRNMFLFVAVGSGLTPVLEAPRKKTTSRSPLDPLRSPLDPSHLSSFDGPVELSSPEGFGPTGPPRRWCGDPRHRTDQGLPNHGALARAALTSATCWSGSCSTAHATSSHVGKSTSSSEEASTGTCACAGPLACALCARVRARRFVDTCARRLRQQVRR